MLKKWILIFSLVLTLGFLAAQVNITPIRTDVTGFTDWTDTSVAGTTYLQLLVANANTISPAMNFNNFTSETLNFKARTYGGTNTVENEITVSISIDNGLNWTVLGTRTPTTSSLSAQTAFDLSSYNGTQVKVKFSVAGTSSSIGAGIDDIAITGVSNANTPTISVNPSTLTGFSYVIGNGPSSTQTFTVSGADLTHDVSIAASTNYQISKSAGSGYTTPLTFTIAELATPQTVYVRLVSGLSVGSYNSETITASSTGATNKTVTCSGSVTAPPSPTITVSTGTLTGFNYEVGSGPSATQTFTVSGAHLTANISIAAATNYEISETAGSGYTSPITLNHSSGVVGVTTIYVRLKSGLSVGSYNDDDIVITSTDADTKEVTCSGSVSSLAFAEIDLLDEVTEDFDTLTNGTWTNGLTVQGWYAKTDATASITTYAANTGSTTAAGLYAFGVAGTNALTDRALGFATTNAFTGSAGTGKGYIGWRLKNTTGTTINRLTVTWTGEQWRRESNTSAHTLNLFYQTGETVSNPTSGSWTSASSVFTSPITGSSALTLDGNAPANRVADIVALLTGLNLAAGQEIMLRWEDLNDAGNDHAMAIDDVSVKVTYDYPVNQTVQAGANTIRVTGGHAHTGSGQVPAWNNPNLNPENVTSYVLQMIGGGPWTVEITTALPWGAAYYQSEWHSVANVGGKVTFNIPSFKGPEVPIILGDQDPVTLPVTFASFTVALSSYNAAVLTWVTHTESGIQGYYVYRSNEAELSTAELASNLIPALNSSQQQIYRYTDNELFATGTYYYWLQVSDFDGTTIFHGPVTLTYTIGGDNPVPTIPNITELRNIYPNPFNPSTQISFGLANPAVVSFIIYNSKGQTIRNINLGMKDAGNWTQVWDGTDNNGRTASTGIYYIKMQAGKDSFTTKAVLMK